jgi:predicted nuclease with RNAse H fold
VIAAARNHFVGIDLTSSPKKPSAYAALDANLSIIRLGLLSTDPEIVATIGKIQPAIVAIDAPLSLPKGLCCLEESCSCQQVSPGKGRTCERELRARYGIMSYYTTKKSIIKVMVKRAIALKSEICRHGYQVIEVYPYATKVRLWGKDIRIPKKTTPAGLEFLREHLAALIPGLEREGVKSHDLCDALIAAYTAYLHARGMAEPVGDAEEGLLFIPKLQVEA